MKSKDIVLGALNGGSFSRLPMWYGAEPDTTKNVIDYLGVKNEEEAMQKFQVDFRTVRPRYIGPELKRYEDGTFDTMWGIKRGGGFWGIALNHPLLEMQSLDDFNKYDFPKVEWFDVTFTEQDKKLSEEYAIIGGDWSPFWHDAMDLMTLEKMFMDLITDPDLVMAVVNKCFDFHYEITQKCFEQYAEYVDIFWFANDLGTKCNLLIDPEMWRKYFKPLQKKLADLGHKYGKKVAMHSCGDIHQILPDLIEIGIEIINPVQLSCDNMDPVVLKKEYEKDLVFFGAIDYNELLTYGTEQQIREGVRKMIDILGYDGRYIVAPSHDLLMPEVPPQSFWAMYDEAAKYSVKYAR